MNKYLIYIFLVIIISTPAVSEAGIIDSLQKQVRNLKQSLSDLHNNIDRNLSNNAMIGAAAGSLSNDASGGLFGWSKENILAYTNNEYSPGFNYGFRSLALSSNGNKMIGAISLYSNTLYTWDSVAGWIKRTLPSGVFASAVTSSSNGQILAAAHPNNFPRVIYTSNDSGATWRELVAATDKGSEYIQMSADGTKLVVKSGRDLTVYTTSDGGVNWGLSQTIATGLFWHKMEFSEDLNTVIGFGHTGSQSLSSVYTSTNGGVSWQNRNIANYWTSTLVAVSGDGSKFAVHSASNGVISEDRLYIGGTSGSFQTPVAVGGGHKTALKMSGDGSVVVVLTSSVIRASTDGGVSFISSPALTDVRENPLTLQLSRDGKKIVYSGDTNLVVGKLSSTFTILTPENNSTHTSWAPAVFWNSASSCGYNFDLGTNGVFTSVDCSKSGSDIPQPSSGAHVFYAKSTNSLGSSETSSASFTYNPPQSSITSPVAGDYIGTGWAPVVFWSNAVTCGYHFDLGINGPFTTIDCSRAGNNIPSPSTSGSHTLYTKATYQDGSSNTDSVPFTYISFVWTSQSVPLANPGSTSNTVYHLDSSADGTKVVGVGASALSGQNSYYIFTSLNGSSPLLKINTDKAWSSISISNGGKIVATESLGNVYLSQTLEGTMSPIASLPRNNWTGIHISSAGNRITAIYDNRYAQISTDGGSSFGNPIDLLGLAANGYPNFRYSEDGRKILFNKNTIGIYYYSADTGVATAVPNGSGLSFVGHTPDGSKAYGDKLVSGVKHIFEINLSTGSISDKGPIGGQDFSRNGMAVSNSGVIALNTFNGVDLFDFRISLNGGGVFQTHIPNSITGSTASTPDISSDGSKIFITALDPNATRYARLYVGSIGGGSTSDTSPPSQVTLVSSNTTQTSTNLSWSVATDNTGVDHYTIYKNSTSQGDFSGNSHIVTGLVPDTTYNFTVYAVDAAGNQTVSNIASVTTLPITIPPTAPVLTSIGSPKTVLENANLSFNLSSTDANGDFVSYSTATALPTNATLSSTGVFSFSPTYAQSGSYAITFIVTDSTTRTDSEVVVVNVTNVNRSPTANAGLDDSATLGIGKNISGSLSSDPDGDALTYLWAVVTNPSNVTVNFSSTSVVSPTVTFGSAGVVTLRLTVRDTSNASAQDTVVFNVSADPNADNDGDFVINSNDLCPNTPSTTVVNLRGCPLPPVPVGATMRPDISSASALLNLNSLNSLEIENSNARIAWATTTTTYSVMRTSGNNMIPIDLSSNIIMGNRSVDLRSINIPELNRAARLTFKNITILLADIAILKDGSYCTTCSNPIYDTGGDTYSFDVAGFSEYELVDNEDPVVSITSPLTGSTAAAPVTITANATDDIAVAEVKFYQSTTLIGTDTSSPYSISWSPSAGTYSIVAVAKDAAGKYATSSVASVTTTVTANTVTPRKSSGGGGGGGTKTTAPQITKSLKKGSKDAQVKILQSLLIKEKLLASTTNIFDTKTESATKLFQTKYKLKVTGKIDTKTKAKINEILKKNATVKPTTPTKPTTTTPELSVKALGLKQNAVGPDVTILQTFLEKSKYLIMPKGVSKGQFGPATKAALIKWQIANKITPADGTVNVGTVAKLKTLGY